MIFNQDVSKCAFLATAAASGTSDGSGSFPTEGSAAIGAFSGNPDGVVVTRWSDSANAQENFPVMVAVFC